MGTFRRTIADCAAVAFGTVTAPVLRFIATHRISLKRFQRFSDRAGFQLRGPHYYEPTYPESHLPDDTAVERDLPGLDLNGEEQLALLARFTFADELKAIPLEKPGVAEFGYLNKMCSVGDAEAYYSFIRYFKPRRIIEIGSGNSTLMGQLAVAANERDDPAYRCDRICVEPYEAPWLERTGVKVLRQRVETVPLEIFDDLEANDILFIDSSHVIRPWGDVLREFQQIVPRLKPGVLIQVDDIFTPRDYPEPWLRWERRLWNEQYLLEAFLTFNPRYRVLCANNWLRNRHFEAFATAFPMMRQFPERNPGAFWFVVNDTA